jgi:PAS domain S-box-containing protein
MDEITKIRTPSELPVPWTGRLLTMIEKLENTNIVIVGGGNTCMSFLEAILDDNFDNRPVVLGVADTNDTAAGLVYAKRRGIFTTADYRELFDVASLDLIVELTRDDRLAAEIRKVKPPGILLIDHYEARTILEYLQIERKKTEILTKIREKSDDSARIEDQVEKFYRFILDTARERNTYAQNMRSNLVASEQFMTQIIQGSTIPTLVIDREHRVTHWNRACEKLTGFKSSEIVGTDNQWKPFRSEKRPIMADLIVDGIKEEEVWRLYGSRWKKSDLLTGAYEAEEFFEHLAPGGLWLFFTAAPIKGPDGKIVGAIETLWDRTREKQAEEERDLQSRKLSRKAEELAASERTMTQIIQGSTIPTFVIDKDHVVTHWNRALENLTGHPASEIVGTHRQWAPFYEEKRLSMADVILDQMDEWEVEKLYGTKWHKSVLIDGGYEAEGFFPNLGENGKWCWFTAAPLKSPDGSVVGAIETIWDKTEDKKAEQERDRHMQELATLCSIYSSLSGALNLEDRINASIEEVANIFSADGICVFIRQSDGNYHLRYSYGYSETLCHENRVADKSSLVFHAAQGGKILVFENFPDEESEEIKLLARDGLRSAAYIPILNSEKKAFGVIRTASEKAHVFNLEEQRLLELIANRIGVAIENSMLQADVRRKADFQAKLIGSSQEGIVATDEKWAIVIFNPAAEKIFGRDASDVIGKMTIRDLYPPAIAERFKAQSVVRADRPKLPWEESSVMSATGEEIPVKFSGTILGRKARMLGSVAFFQDLREIKRLEGELVSAERLAAIGQTVAGMAHCIKNILHGLKGGSYLVDVGINKNETEKLKSGWQMLQRNINRTSDLVMDLLTYSKGREPEFEPCFPNEIADDVCELLKDVAANNEVEIAKEFSPLIPEVVMDPRTLHRSLMNLVSNAIDACIFDESVGKQHRVTVLTEPLDGKMIRFDVSDNGSGMDEEVQAKLFSSFFSTKGPKGTGLGLLVTRKLVEEHKGTIEVSSRLGEGTTFSIKLPYTEKK